MGTNKCKHGCVVGQMQCFLCDIESTIKYLAERIELLEKDKRTTTQRDGGD